MSELRATFCDRQGCDAVERVYIDPCWLTLSTEDRVHKLHFCRDCIPKVCDAIAPLTGRELLEAVVGIRMLPGRKGA